MLHRTPPHAILFDLDGTLADTAPDLAAAINLLQTSRDLIPTPFSVLRPCTSQGARGLLHASFGITPEDVIYSSLREEFLKNYQAAIAVKSTLFPGVKDLLDSLRDRAIHWGIVTNKSTSLTERLAPLLGLDSAECLVCGDSTAHSKPHPAPLFEAARRLNLSTQTCWYVGDDIRDIQAARAAGMLAVAVSWGYAGSREPTSWGADILLHGPSELLTYF